MSADARNASPTPARVYERDGIRVLWEARYCIHAAECVRGLPGVFRPKDRPWIQPENAPSADALAEVVRRCPTGALRYERTDGAPSERDLLAAAMPDPSHSPTAPLPIVTASPDGPLLVTGVVRVTAADGTLLREAERVALCRCGASKTKPFCDGSHRAIGWTSADAPVPPPPPAVPETP